MRSEFGNICRELRVAKSLKHRDISIVIGVAVSTYSNVESAPHVIVRRDRALKLADFHGLVDEPRARFLAAYDALPLSEFGIKQRERWSKMNVRRSKARHHDALQLSLVEMISLSLSVAPDPDTLCACDFVGGTIDDPTRPCELCAALDALGLPMFTTKERAIDDLAKLSVKLEAERVKQNGVTP